MQNYRQKPDLHEPRYQGANATAMPIIKTIKDSFGSREVDIASPYVKRRLQTYQKRQGTSGLHFYLTATNRLRSVNFAHVGNAPLVLLAFV